MNRKTVGNILVVVLLIVVMIGLNLLLHVDNREETENEERAVRSTYSGRTYGIKAYYDLLGEMKFPVGRLLRPFTELKNMPQARVVFHFPPSPTLSPSKDEINALRQWVFEGGIVVVADRTLMIEFGNHTVMSLPLPAPEQFKKDSLELSSDRRGVIAPWQPMNWFRNVERIAVSDHAAALYWKRNSDKDPDEDANDPEQNPETVEPFPFPVDPNKPEPNDPTTEAVFVPYAGRGESPVVGSLTYGKGQVVFIGDQFIFANNGIGLEDNAVFGVNLVEDLLANSGLSTPQNGKVLFDEFHHGYREGGVSPATLAGYFRGTAVPLVFWQFVVVSLLALYSMGRRFGRPVPLKRKNRAATLEYVSAMAQIQKVANSYDLALENIHIRFFRALCRYGGVPTTISVEKLAVAVGRRAHRNPDEIRALLLRIRDILNGKATTEEEMVRLTKQIRSLETALGL